MISPPVRQFFILAILYLSTSNKHVDARTSVFTKSVLSQSTSTATIISAIVESSNATKRAVSVIQKDGPNPSFTISWSPSFRLRLHLSRDKLVELIRSQEDNPDGTIAIDTSFNITANFTLPGVLGRKANKIKDEKSLEKADMTTMLIPVMPTTTMSNLESEMTTKMAEKYDDSTEVPTTESPETGTSSQVETTTILEKLEPEILTTMTSYELDKTTKMSDEGSTMLPTNKSQTTESLNIFKETYTINNLKELSSTPSSTEFPPQSATEFPSAIFTTEETPSPEMSTTTESSTETSTLNPQVKTTTSFDSEPTSTELPLMREPKVLDTEIRFNTIFTTPISEETTFPLIDETTKMPTFEIETTTSTSEKTTITSIIDFEELTPVPEETTQTSIVELERTTQLYDEITQTSEEITTTTSSTSPSQTIPFTTPQSLSPESTPSPSTLSNLLPETTLSPTEVPSSSSPPDDTQLPTEQTPTLESSPPLSETTTPLPAEELYTLENLSFQPETSTTESPSSLSNILPSFPTETITPTTPSNKVPTTTETTLTTPPTATSTPATTTLFPDDFDFSETPIDGGKLIIENEYRRDVIFNMTKEAFEAYVAHSWGRDAHQPKPEHFWRRKRQASSEPENLFNGHTIVSAMDTLLISGHAQLYKKARDYVLQELQINELNQNSIDDLYEALVATYTLTSDRRLIQKAAAFARQYKSPSIEPEFFKENYNSWANHRLPFRYLTDRTKNPQYWDKIAPLEEYLKSQELLFTQTDGQELPEKFKTYLQAPGRTGAEQTLASVEMAISSMEAANQITWTPSGKLAYVRTENSSSEPKTHSHIRYCSYATMFALLSSTSTEPEAQARYLRLATGLTETCYKASTSSRSWLPYENFTINEMDQISGSGGYDLGPTVAEAYFTMYRLTGDNRYRNYAWDLASHLNHFAGSSVNGLVNRAGGFAAIKDVNALLPTKEDRQPPHLFGTLKFLFLTFSKVNYIPIDQWVFTASGHPLPICGKNAAYPKSRCL